MSIVNSLICLAIAVVAILRLNHLSSHSSYLRRGVLVMLAAGGFGVAMQPLEPDLTAYWPDVMFSSGVLVSMVVRYYRPHLYDDRKNDESAPAFTVVYGKPEKERRRA